MASVNAPNQTLHWNLVIIVKIKGFNVFHHPNNKEENVKYLQIPV